MADRREDLDRLKRNKQEELPADLSKAKKLLELYSGIPADQVEPHLRAVVSASLGTAPGLSGRASGWHVRV